MQYKLHSFANFRPRGLYQTKSSMTLYNMYMYIHLQRPYFKMPTQKLLLVKSQNRKKERDMVCGVVNITEY